jgi:hypothetical protein
MCRQTADVANQFGDGPPQKKREDVQDDVALGRKAVWTVTEAEISDEQGCRKRRQEGHGPD